MWDLAPHDLSILDFMLPRRGAPGRGGGPGLRPDRRRPGLRRLPVGQLNTGAIAHIHVNWLSPIKIRTMVVGGSTRTLVWDDLNPTQRLSFYDRGVDTVPAAEIGRADRRRAQISYRTGDMVAPALVEREALREVMSEFAGAITEGRQALTDGSAGVRVMRMLNAASASLAQGGAFIDLEDVK